MVAVGVGEINIQRGGRLHITGESIQPGATVEQDVVFGEKIAGGLSFVGRHKSTGTQHNEFHFSSSQNLIMNFAAFRERRWPRADRSVSPLVPGCAPALFPVSRLVDMDGRMSAHPKHPPPQKCVRRKGSASPSTLVDSLFHPIVR